MGGQTGARFATLAILVVLTLPSAAKAQAPAFTDWTSAGGGQAAGSLAGTGVTLSGSAITSPPGSVIDGSSTYFSASAFSPPLASSDAPEIHGRNGYSYALSFSRPTTNPVIHLGTLASQLDFTPGTSITRLSGQANFTVAGSSVRGQLGPAEGSLSDNNGSVRLNGTFTSVGFSATPQFLDGNTPDGILIQVGSTPAAPTPPPPPPPVVESVTPLSPPRAGQPAIFQAKVSGNVSRLSWNLGGDARPEITGRPDQTILRFRPPVTLAGRGFTGSLTAVGAGGSVTSTFVAGPSGSAFLTPGLRNVFKKIGSPKPSYAVSIPGRGGVLSGPSDIGRTQSDRASRLCAFTTASKPPTTIRVGNVEARGCLFPIDSLADIPAAERGVLDDLVRKMRGDLTRAQMDQVLKATNGFISPVGANVNGLALSTLRSAKLVVYPELNAVASSAAKAAVGKIPLDNPDRFVLDLRDRFGGEIGALAGVAKNLKLAGFRMFGDVRVKLLKPNGVVPAAAQVTANLKLPEFLRFGGADAQGQVVFRATIDGLQLENMRIGPINADIGALRVDSFQLDYKPDDFTNPDGPGEWNGKGRACIPPKGSCLDMIPDKGGVTIRTNDPRFPSGLKYAGATLFFRPPLPLFPSVNLDHIGFQLGLDPTRISANAGVTAAKIYDFNGRMLVAFPSTAAPFVFDKSAVGPNFPQQFYGRSHTRFTLAASANAGVKVPVIGRVPLGNGYFLYEFPGYVAFGGGVTQDFLGIVSFNGGMGGELNAENGRFNLGGHVSACLTALCRGAAGVVSSNGLAACIDIAIADTGVGIRYKPFKIVPYVWGCRWSPYAEKNVRGSRVAQAGRPYLVKFDSDDPSRAIRLEGAGGPPRVKVTGPGGQSVVSGAEPVTTAGSLRILRLDKPGLTTVGVRDNARSGTYRIEALPGSPAIKRISEASALPAAGVRARVRGKGNRRRLDFRVRPRAGQRVTFTEVTREGSAKTIGTTARARGSLRFTPAPGRGTRRVVASFELSGVPGEKTTAARFRPPSPALARVRGLGVRRRGTRLALRWKAVRGATRYQVVLTPRVGRQRLVTVRGRRAVLRRVSKSVAGTVSVRAIDSARQGRPVARRFRATAKRKTAFRTLPRLGRLKKR